MRARAARALPRGARARGRSPRRSEQELDGQLHLPRVADALAEEAVEVEETRRRERVDVVRVVEGVEHLDDGDERLALAEAERALQAPVEGEELVVLARRVAVRRRAHAPRDRLRAARLHAGVAFEAPRQLRVRVEVELVADVAVGERVVEL